MLCNIEYAIIQYAIIQYAIIRFMRKFVHIYLMFYKCYMYLRIIVDTLPSKFFFNKLK